MTSVFMGQLGREKVFNTMAVDPEAVQLAGARMNSGSELQSQSGPNRRVSGDSIPQLTEKRHKTVSALIWHESVTWTKIVAPWIYQEFYYQ